MPMNRRSFLRLLSAGSVAAAFPDSISRALSIRPHHRTGTIADVEHVIFLMQENRSFDHYFGTLSGVRGFGDPRAMKLPDGKPIYCQPTDNGYVLPFHPPAPEMGLQFLEDLAHDWTSTHEALNGGQNNRWVPTKGPVSMAHLTRSDIPFHYALADAFTICDAYHCSVLGPTYPNRYHMWTGWTGNDGEHGGPAVDNAKSGLGWMTYPERLEQAGISWKIYQDIGTGAPDPYSGNYGCNSLLNFYQYQNASAGNPLSRAAQGTNIGKSGTLFDGLRGDIRRRRLPQVSWIVPPEAYTEHPNWPANYGAWYVSQILDALTEDPEVWSKTAFFLMYDENDGFFDHISPPMPPQTPAQGLSTVETTNESFAGSAGCPPGPYGLGIRVPMIVISPWSRGGWVNSEVFDHTSMIQFLEKRFGVGRPQLTESNITPWRRAVCGDLTSAFNFAAADEAHVSMPSTLAYQPPQKIRYPDYSPSPPTEQAMPAQERGMRPARAVPYSPSVSGHASFTDKNFQITFGNNGTAATVYQVHSRDGQGGPWTYTVAPNTTLVDTWSPGTNGRSEYYLSVYGPNGYLRTYKGSVRGQGRANLGVSWHPATSGASKVNIKLRNYRPGPCTVTVWDKYTGQPWSEEIAPHGKSTLAIDMEQSHGWYDLIVTVDSDPSFYWKLAGHLETGKDSKTDPAIGAVFTTAIQD